MKYYFATDEMQNKKDNAKKNAKFWYRYAVGLCLIMSTPFVVTALVAYPVGIIMPTAFVLLSFLYVVFKNPHKDEVDDSIKALQEKIIPIEKHVQSMSNKMQYRMCLDVEINVVELLRRLLSVGGKVEGDPMESIKGKLLEHGIYCDNIEICCGYLSWFVTKEKHSSFKTVYCDVFKGFDFDINFRQPLAVARDKDGHYIFLDKIFPEVDVHSCVTITNEGRYLIIRTINGGSLYLGFPLADIIDDLHLVKQYYGDAMYEIVSLSENTESNIFSSQFKYDNSQFETDEISWKKTGGDKVCDVLNDELREAARYSGVKVLNQKMSSHVWVAENTTVRLKIQF